MKILYALTLVAAGVMTTVCVGTAWSSPSPLGSIAPTSANSGATRYAAQCMTDDGYGRKLPCSFRFKREHPNWRAGDNCFTDDGYGRHRPCSAGYKARHAR